MEQLGIVGSLDISQIKSQVDELNRVLGTLENSFRKVENVFSSVESSLGKVQGASKGLSDTLAGVRTSLSGMGNITQVATQVQKSVQEIQKTATGIKLDFKISDPGKSIKPWIDELQLVEKQVRSVTEKINKETQQTRSRFSDSADEISNFRGAMVATGKGQIPIWNEARTNLQSMVDVLGSYVVNLEKANQRGKLLGKKSLRTEMITGPFQQAQDMLFSFTDMVKGTPVSELFADWEDPLRSFSTSMEKTFGSTKWLTLFQKNFEPFRGTLAELAAVPAQQMSTAFTSLIPESKAMGALFMDIFTAKGPQELEASLRSLRANLAMLMPESAGAKALFMNFQELATLLRTRFLATSFIDFEPVITQALFRVGQLTEEFIQAKAAGRDTSQIVIGLAAAARELASEAQRVGVGIQGFMARAPGAGMETSITRLESAFQEEGLVAQETGNRAQEFFNIIRAGQTSLKQTANEIEKTAAATGKWGELARSTYVDLRRIVSTYQSFGRPTVISGIPESASTSAEKLSSTAAIPRDLKRQVDSLAGAYGLWATADITARQSFQRTGYITLDILRQLYKGFGEVAARPMMPAARVQELQRVRGALEKLLPPMELSKTVSTTAYNSFQFLARGATQFSNLIPKIVERLNASILKTRVDIVDPTAATKAIQPFEALKKVLVGLQGDLQVIAQEITLLYAKGAPSIEAIAQAFMKIRPETLERAFQAVTELQGAGRMLGARAVTGPLDVALAQVKAIGQIPPAFEQAFAKIQPMTTGFLDPEVAKRSMKVFAADLAGMFGGIDVVRSARKNGEQWAVNFTQAVNQGVKPISQFIKEQPGAPIPPEMVQKLQSQMAQAFFSAKLPQLFSGIEESLFTSVGILNRMGPAAEKFRAPLQQAQLDTQRLVELFLKIKFPDLRAGEDVGVLERDFSKLSSKISTDLKASFGGVGETIMGQLAQAYKSLGKLPMGAQLFGLAGNTDQMLRQVFGVFSRLLPTLKTEMLQTFDMPLEMATEFFGKLQQDAIQFRALVSQSAQPLISMKDALAGTANVFERLNMARRLGAPAEVVESIRAEADAFMKDKEQARQLSKQKEELGAAESNVGRLTELAITFLERETKSFSNLGQAANISLGALTSVISKQAGLFKGLTRDMGIKDLLTFEGVVPTGITPEVSKYLQAFYNNVGTNLDKLRQVTDQKIGVWSVGFGKGMNNFASVVKQNAFRLRGVMETVQSSAATGAQFRWEGLFDEPTVLALQKSSGRISSVLKRFQEDLMKFGQGTARRVEFGPVTQSLQQELAFVLNLAESVRQKIAVGEVGTEQLPAVNRLFQYAIQLDGAITALERPYQRMSEVASKGKASFTQLGRTFGSELYKATQEMGRSVTGLKQPIGLIVQKMFGEIFVPENLERITEFRGITEFLGERFPSQVQFALNVAAKRGIPVQKLLQQMIPVNAATLEEAFRNAPDVPRVLLEKMFRPESSLKFQQTAKGVVEQIIRAPMKEGLQRASELMSVDALKSFSQFSLADSILQPARRDLSKLRQVGPEYASQLNQVINYISAVLKTVPTGRRMGGILEQAGFDYSQIQALQAFVRGAQGPLYQLRNILTQAADPLKGISPEKMKLDLGLDRTVMGNLQRAAGDEEKLGKMTQFLSTMYDQAGASLIEFVARQETWSSKSIQDLTELMSFWKGLGEIIRLITQELPKMGTAQGLMGFEFKASDLLTRGAEAGSSFRQGLMQSMDLAAIGGGIGKMLAAIIAKDPEMIFEIMRTGSIRLREELRRLGYEGKGSIGALASSIEKLLPGTTLGPQFFGAYFEANERFFLESDKTTLAIMNIVQGFEQIRPTAAANLVATLERASAALHEADISFRGFGEGLGAHTVEFKAFSDKQRTLIQQYASGMAGAIKSQAALYQADPFERSFVRLIRSEDTLFDQLRNVIQTRGNEIKQVNEQAYKGLTEFISKPISTRTVADIAKVSQMPGLEQFTDIGGLLTKLAGVRRLFENVGQSVKSLQGMKPFEGYVRDAASLEVNMLKVMRTITSSLDRISQGKGMQLNVKESLVELGSLRERLSVITSEMQGWAQASAAGGAQLPYSFELTANSVAKMGRVLENVISVLRALPASGRVTEQSLQRLNDLSKDLWGSLKAVDQITLKDLGAQIEAIFSKAFGEKMGPWLYQGFAKVPAGARTFFGNFQKQLQTEGSNVNVLLQTMSTEFQSIFAKFGGRPQLMLQYFEKATPQMRLLLSQFFEQAGLLTGAGFQSWITQWSQYMGEMNIEEKKGLEKLQKQMLEGLSTFRETKFFPEPKVPTTLFDVAKALRQVGMSLQEIRQISDLGFIKLWGEALTQPFKMIIGQAGEVSVGLGGVFSIIGNKMAVFANSLDAVRQAFLGLRQDSVQVQEGFVAFITLIEKLSAAFRESKVVGSQWGVEIVSQLSVLGTVGKSLSDFTKGAAGIADFPRILREIDFGGLGQQLTTFMTGMGGAAAQTQVPEQFMAPLKSFLGMAKQLNQFAFAAENILKLTQAFSTLQAQLGSSQAVFQSFEGTFQIFRKMFELLPTLSIPMGPAVPAGAIESARNFAQVIAPLASAIRSVQDINFDAAINNINRAATEFKAALEKLFLALEQVPISSQTQKVISFLSRLATAFSKIDWTVNPQVITQQFVSTARAIEKGQQIVEGQVQEGAAQIASAAEKAGDQIKRSGLGSLGDLVEPSLISLFGAGEEPVPEYLRTTSQAYTQTLQGIGERTRMLVTEFAQASGQANIFGETLMQMARGGPSAAFRQMVDDLIMLGPAITQDTTKFNEMRQSLERFLTDVSQMKGVGAQFTELSARIGTPAMMGPSGLVQTLSDTARAIDKVQKAGAETTFLDMMIKSRSKAQELHIQVGGLLNYMQSMGPRLRESLTTGFARREFYSQISDIRRALEQAMTPLRGFVGFPQIRVDMEKMSSDLSRMSSMSTGILTVWDRFSGVIRSARDSFLNLIAYQTRWYLSMQIFWAVFGQMDQVIMNFGKLDTEVRRATRTIRDLNFAVLGVDPALRAMAQVGVESARHIEKIFRTLFMAQIRTTFYNMMRSLGASTQEVGEVLYQLGSAGLNVNTSLAAVVPTLRMIIGSEADTTESTKLVAGAYYLYGDSLQGAMTDTEKFARITDILSASFRDHLVELNEMVTGMGYVITTGKLSGLSFEELAAALGVLNDNMLRGSKAGRSLNQMLVHLAQRTQDVKISLMQVAQQHGAGDVVAEAFKKIEQEAATQGRQVRPFDYLIEAGKILEPVLAKAGLSTENLANQAQIMGIIGSRAYAVLLLKAREYGQALFQLQYTSFGAGEQMSDVMVTGFARAVNRIEGFARSGMGRVFGIFKGTVEGIGGSLVRLEDTTRGVFGTFGLEVNNAKSLISSFLLILSAQAVLKIWGKSLPFFPNIKKTIEDFKNWRATTQETSAAFMNFSRAAFTSTTPIEKLGLLTRQYFEKVPETGRLSSALRGANLQFVALTGNVGALTEQQRVAVQSVTQFGKVLTQVMAGAPIGQMRLYLDQVSQVSAVQQILTTRPFKIQIDTAEAVARLRSGELSIGSFRQKFFELQKEAAKGGIKFPQFMGATFLTSGVEAIRSLSGTYAQFEDVIRGVSKGSIGDFTKFQQVVSDPAAWNQFVTTVKTAAQTGEESMVRLSESIVGINEKGTIPAARAFEAQMARFGVAVQTEAMKSMTWGRYLGEVFKVAFPGLVNLWSGIKNFGATSQRVFSAFVVLIRSATSSMRGLETASALATIRIAGLGAAAKAFAALRAVLAAVTGNLLQLALQIATTLLYAYGFDKALNWWERLTRGVDKYAEEVGQAGAEFQKSVAFMTAPLPQMISYFERVGETLDEMMASDRTFFVKTDSIDNAVAKFSELSMLVQSSTMSEIKILVDTGRLTEANVLLRQSIPEIVKAREEAAKRVFMNFGNFGRDFSIMVMSSKPAINKAMKEISELVYKSLSDAERMKIDPNMLKVKTLNISKIPLDKLTPEVIQWQKVGIKAAEQIAEGAASVFQTGARVLSLMMRIDPSKVGKEFALKFTREIQKTVPLIEGSFQEISREMQQGVFGDPRVIEESLDRITKAFVRTASGKKYIGDLTRAMKDFREEVFETKGMTPERFVFTYLPLLAKESSQEVQQLAKVLGDPLVTDLRKALLLVNAFNKELAVFVAEQTKIQEGASIAWNLQSVADLVDALRDKFETLRQKIELVGAEPVADMKQNIESSFKEIEGKIRGHKNLSLKLDVGLVMTDWAVDFNKAFEGAFTYAPESVLGKWEREFYKTADPLREAFSSAFTEISFWAEDAGRSIEQGLSIPGFDAIVKASQSGLTVLERGQRDWVLDLRHNFHSAELYQEEYIKTLNSLAKSGQLTLSQVSTERIPTVDLGGKGGEGGGETSRLEETKKELQASLKEGLDEAQKLAEAIQKNVRGAIDSTIKRVEALLSALSKVVEVNIKVAESARKMSSGYNLANKLLETTIGYAEKLSEQTNLWAVQLQRLQVGFDVSRIAKQFERVTQAYQGSGPELQIGPEKAAERMGQIIDELNKSVDQSMGNLINAVTRAFDIAAKEDEKYIDKRLKNNLKWSDEISASDDTYYQNQIQEIDKLTSVSETEKERRKAQIQSEIEWSKKVADVRKAKLEAEAERSKELDQEIRTGELVRFMKEIFGKKGELTLDEQGMETALQKLSIKSPELMFALKSYQGTQEAAKNQLEAIATFNESIEKNIRNNLKQAEDQLKELSIIDKSVEKFAIDVGKQLREIAFALKKGKIGNGPGEVFDLMDKLKGTVSIPNIAETSSGTYKLASEETSARALDINMVKESVLAFDQSLDQVSKSLSEGGFEQLQQNLQALSGGMNNFLQRMIEGQSPEQLRQAAVSVRQAAVSVSETLESAQTKLSGAAANNVNMLEEVVRATRSLGTLPYIAETSKPAPKETTLRAFGMTYGKVTFDLNSVGEKIQNGAATIQQGAQVTGQALVDAGQEIERSGVAAAQRIAGVEISTPINQMKTSLTSYSRGFTNVMSSMKDKLQVFTEFRMPDQDPAALTRIFGDLVSSFGGYSESLRRITLPEGIPEFGMVKESVLAFDQSLDQVSKSLGESQISSKGFEQLQQNLQALSGGMNNFLQRMIEGQSPEQLRQAAVSVSKTLESAQTKLSGLSGAAAIQQGAPAIAAATDLVNISFNTVADNAKNLANILEEVVREIGSRGSIPIPTSGVVTKQFGGPIPGFGGGDKHHVLAEGGEFVIRKEMVRRYGQDLFNAYNEGKIKADELAAWMGISAIKSAVQKQKILESPVKRFSLDIVGTPFKGLATEDMLTQLEKGLKRKRMVGQNK